MNKNWRNKWVAALAIAILAFALATPANALIVKPSDCNTDKNPTSCYNVDENILTNDTLNALAEFGTCTATVISANNQCTTSDCTDTTATTTNIVANNSSNKSFDIQSFNNFWTNLFSNLKQNSSVVINPTTSAEPSVVTTTPTTPVETPVITNPTTGSQENPVVTKPAEPVEQPVVTQPTKPVEETPAVAEPTTSTTQAGLSAQEQQLVNLINSERVKAGLSPLTVDIKLAQVARTKAQDMIDNNYFSHTSPTYGSPFDMMKSFGITFKSAGENIAINSSVQKAHVAFMNSEGHRANILNSSFTHVGIGIVSNRGSLYISEMFIGK